LQAQYGEMVQQGLYHLDPQGIRNLIASNGTKTVACTILLIHLSVHCSKDKCGVMISTEMLPKSMWIKASNI